ncbi:MAG: S8 family serine peptidase [Candidatus Edwardsbacteria bacterium]|jgi:hypothetical protein|nr:S8 family serine peptidase [Candidatus Edwardsbacteria bacterium]
MYRPIRIVVIAACCLAFTAAACLAAPMGGAGQAMAPIAPAAAGVQAAEPYGGAGLITFSNGIVIDTDRGQPALPAELTIKDYAPGQTGYYIVQFAGPVQQSWKQELEARGAALLDYLPNYAFVVRMTAEAAGGVRSLAAVRWVGTYQPAYKVSNQPEFTAKSGRQTVVVMLHRGEDLARATAALTALGAQVLEATDSKRLQIIKADADLAALDRIAAIDAVSWVEPWHPIRLMNDQCQYVVQDGVGGSRTIWAKGIRGEGQVLSSSDSGVRVAHNAFFDGSVSLTTWGDYPTHRKVVAYKQVGSATFGDESANYYHGSHTGGTLCGDDSVNGGSSAYDGMAYKARLYFFDCGGSSGGLYMYNDLAYLFGPAHSGVSGYPETRAYMMSNSWGSQQSSGPMPYDAQCASLDDYTWQHKDFLPFFSQGNTDGGPYIGAPAVSKNCVSVGATMNGASAATVASFSVVGPTADNRRKPMIVAPGNNLYSVNGANSTGYQTMSGTSMSCPAAAGATVLARQYFTEGWYPSGVKTPADAFIPSAALLKSVLLAGADKGSPVIPDTRYGWGRLDLDSSLYFSGDYRRLAVIDDTVGLQTGQYKEYTVSIPDSLCIMRVALCWTDYPGSPGAGRMIVNDLDLTVIDPYGTTYRGNNFTSSQSNTNATLDTVNVEENVRRNRAAYRTGTYVVRVSARNTPQGPQPYALAVTGPVSGSLTWTPAPLIGVLSNTVLDAGQTRPNGKLDPGETDSIRIVLVNTGPVDAAGVTAKLRTGSTYVTKVDSTAAYGTLAANGGSSAGDNFLVTMAGGTPEGTTIPFVLHWEDAAGDSANIAFNLVCGIARYATYDHNLSNVLLTVTKWGSIGFLNVAATGNGFKYPQATQHLYHASFMAGNANNYVVDRFYPSTGQTGSDSGNTDWKCLTRPDSGVTPLGAIVSMQDSWAQFNDSSAWFGGASTAKGLTVTQEGYSWIAPYDFVVLKYKLHNRGGTALNGMYAGIVADFDMGASAATNLGEADTTVRHAVYQRQRTPGNPCVGLKLLEGAYANASLLRNNHASVSYPGYVYNGATNIWNDSTAYKFLRGAIKKPSAMAVADTADYSTFISAGPFDLPAGDSTTVAFAFVAADTAPEFWEMCDSAQAVYDRTFLGVAGTPWSPALPLRVSLSQNRPNPFGQRTEIGYQLPQAGRVVLRVYNIAGQAVRTLVDGAQTAGSYSYTWDGRDDGQRELSAGIYIYKLDAGNSSATRKLVLVK